MKLEPGRTSLSGRPDFLKPQAPLQTVLPELEPRKCVSCSCDDVVHQVHAEGDVKYEHKVTLEMRYLAKAEDLTPYLASKGWKARILQGRPAMQRFICRPCLIGHELMQKEFNRKRAKELRSSLNHDTYYTAVCGE
jgi:hypothetical protein